MPKELTQDWLDWIFENIQRGCDRKELLDILLKEGFDPQLCKIALGYELSKNEIKNKQEKAFLNPKNFAISADQIRDVSAEIYEIEGFLNDDECNLLIKKIKSKLRPSTIATSGIYDDSFRTSSTCDLGNLDDLFMQEIDSRLCNFIGIDSSFGEIVQGQHYLENQEFKAHTDYFEGTQLLEHDGGRGQRTYTFMIYLNDVIEGGETEFPKLNKSFIPKKGTALIWNNLNEDGSLNSNTIHQAHPVLKGEKTVITKWFRQASLTLDDKTDDLNKHIQTYTDEGFKKEQLDADLFNEIKEYLALHKDDFYDEFVEGNFIQSDKVDVPSRLFELSDELKNKIHNSLQKPMEAWSKTKLEPTFVYGIRDYKKGAVLIPHRDRNETHIISAIINIDKKVEKDWPLEIDDHFYRRHEVFLEPGEVLFYESARLLHGRPTPLKGESYSNIFCHYMPKH